MMNVHNPIHIGSVIRNATVFNFKNWTGNIMNSDSLPQSVERLFALLQEREVDYVLVGGVALLNYVGGRNTEDIDLIMSLPSLEKIPEIHITSQNIYFVRGQFGELQIDVLLTQNPLFAKVQSNYTATQRFIEQEIPTATVEGLLLLKLYALPSLYRQGSFAEVGIYENDIATLLHYYQLETKPLIDELSLHLSESDITSIESIVAEIKQRIERFRKGSGE